jgi:predicted  nucleic acid-binding Zn-ribbon protein
MSSPKTQNAIKIIERLKVLFKVKTDTELALRLGVAQSTLASWKKRDSIDYALVIAKCDDGDLNWLFRGDSMEMPQEELEVTQLESEIDAMKAQVQSLRQQLNARVRLKLGDLPQPAS